MSEQLEHALNLLDGQLVSVVRPGYGSQSDHWCGVVNSLGVDYPIRFHFVSPNQQIIFEAEDVVRIDSPKNPGGEYNNEPVIRLKGPQDYTIRLKLSKA